MATEVQIEKKSFKRIWEDIGDRTKKNVIDAYKRETGFSKNTFYNRKNGEGETPLDEAEATLIEEIFERFHYHDIWDKNVG
ncbi:hypothetical protein [Niabella aurantiaca]|uniref:hypothetical protein n=1 Tax=Niabella aurantiaca TaxID=379900 RepID=UPI0003665FA7|nr:hypothetical protein [Niabella aurantiaca]